MATAKRQKKIDRRRPKILAWLFPLRMRELICENCGRPNIEHPNRRPTYRFSRGSAEVFVYRERVGFTKKYVLRVGVWRLGLDEFQLGQLFQRQEFEDLQQSITAAVEFVKGCEEVVEKDASAEMSLRRRFNEE